MYPVSRIRDRAGVVRAVRAERVVAADAGARAAMMSERFLPAFEEIRARLPDIEIAVARGMDAPLRRTAGPGKTAKSRPRSPCRAGRGTRI